jgi:hypothetical protein
MVRSTVESAGRIGNRTSYREQQETDMQGQAVPGGKYSGSGESLSHWRSAQIQTLQEKRKEQATLNKYRK